MEDINAVLSDNNPSMMFVTAFVGRLHIPTGQVLFCNAGHLPPIKVYGNKPHHTTSIELIPNIPLGYDGKFRFEEQGLLLAKDETLVLYTDGLTEAENVRKELFGEDRLLSLAAETAALTVEEQVGRISQAVKDHMGTEPQSDDLTMLSFKYQGDPHTFRYQLKLRNNLSEIPKIETFVNEVASVAGIQDHLTTSSINLALEEAITNVIMYAYPSGIDGPVYLEAVISEGKATFILSDTGKPFDPTVTPSGSDSFESMSEGGMGLGLVHQLASSMYYEREDDENRLTLGFDGIV